MRQTRAWMLALSAVLVVGFSGCGNNPLKALVMDASPSNMTAIVGQRCVFLVRTTHQDQAGPVALSVLAPMSVSSVDPASITENQVGEATVIPGASALNTTLVVSIKGEIGGDSDTEHQNVQVVAGVDTLAVQAAAVRYQFVAWLETNEPGLGITSATTWTPTIVRPGDLAWNYYLFFSDEWEMGIRWEDSALMYLRHRLTEWAPTHAFEIASLLGGTPPSAIGPPFSVFR